MASITRTPSDQPTAPYALGEPFDPLSWPAVIVGRQRGLKDGPKRVYRWLLVFYAAEGRDPSMETMVAELGTSERSIFRDLHVLEKLKLIRIEPTEYPANRYVFLWHPWFCVGSR